MHAQQHIYHREIVGDFSQRDEGNHLGRRIGS